MISNDLASDPRMNNYRDEATRRGYRSSAAFPLICSGKAIGAIRFYAGEVNFFNDREISLLEELVADICFALELIDNTGKPA
jgi:GAF domain-containing protein